MYQVYQGMKATENGRSNFWTMAPELPLIFQVDGLNFHGTRDILWAEADL
jgi:hypothetical protein